MSERTRVNILGSEWSVVTSDQSKDEYLKQVGGYCDYTANTVVYEPHPRMDSSECESFTAPDVENRRIVRHELIHAFLFESGMADDATWPVNEAMVDFFARQFPKLLKAFQEVEAL